MIKRLVLVAVAAVFPALAVGSMTASADARPIDWYSNTKAPSVKAPATTDSGTITIQRAIDWY
ncbi:hypothetical protein [Aeromicrobium sp. IC_218]|uniref:hypothetical protein n=1 Tax=Aeromicrobium sp. IC_218 TaxID=2545468 RepID=UPI00103C47E8|nr:hypothetical protein [Aeromicrobium sp. IC_218]TCI97487.1 hypothetical protein E0W78_11865 [Aeromicrobium sp. IC_218]